MGRTNKKKRSRKVKETFHEPSSGSQVYHGPLTIPQAKLQADLRTVELSFATTITSSGGGQVVNVFPLNISAFNENANFIALFDEWRLLSAEMEFVPAAEGALNTVNLLSLPLVMVCDRDSSGAIPNYSGAINFSSAKVRAINMPQRIIYKMSGSEDAAFITSTSAAAASFKLFANALTPSVNWGVVFCKALWQGRGRF